MTYGRGWAKGETRGRGRATILVVARTSTAETVREKDGFLTPRVAPKVVTEEIEVSVRETVAPT